MLRWWHRSEQGGWDLRGHNLLCSFLLEPDTGCSSSFRFLVQGKRVVVVDDSIVRGTTSSKIVRLIKEAGATEVHMRIASPPMIASCYYGVDTPSRNVRTQMGGGWREGKAREGENEQAEEN